MSTDFQVKPLDYAEFEKLFSMNESELKRLGAKRMITDQKSSFPCRISLEDAGIGEEVILLAYQHHKTDSPYQASGAIFVRKHAKAATLEVNEIPEMLTGRLLSVRAYTQEGFMNQATAVEGADLRGTIEKLFEKPDIAYLHIHNAKPGCYNCAVVRA